MDQQLPHHGQCCVRTARGQPLIQYPTSACIVSCRRVLLSRSLALRPDLHCLPTATRSLTIHAGERAPCRGERSEIRAYSRVTPVRRPCRMGAGYVKQPCRVRSHAGVEHELTAKQPLSRPVRLLPSSSHERPASHHIWTPPDDAHS